MAVALHQHSFRLRYLANEPENQETEGVVLASLRAPRLKLAEDRGQYAKRNRPWRKGAERSENSVPSPPVGGDRKLQKERFACADFPASRTSSLILRYRRHPRR